MEDIEDSRNNKKNSMETIARASEIENCNEEMIEDDA
jgi:hypothetical protein